MTTIDNTQDILDVRDIIALFEELEAECADPEAPEAVPGSLAAELASIAALLEDMRGNGGDEQWRGDWYPVTLVRESYWMAYAQELAEETGAINAEATWPNNCIDWDKAASELKWDYQSTEFDGVTYWYH